MIKIKGINILGPVHFTHKSEHVYFNAFKSGANLFNYFFDSFTSKLSFIVVASVATF